MIAPQSPILEFGTNFTATCIIINSSEVTADDLFWSLAEMTVPEEQYTKINGSALSVTISVTSEKTEWLYCRSKKVSSYVDLNYGRFIHGIKLTKGCKILLTHSLFINMVIISITVCHEYFFKTLLKLHSAHCFKFDSGFQCSRFGVRDIFVGWLTHLCFD